MKRNELTGSRRSLIAFVDGQNLFHTARQAFGYTHPNYDVQQLAAANCNQKGWDLKRVHFYTGVPDPTDNAFWHGFWTNKLAMMGRRGVKVYRRALIYRNKTVTLPEDHELLSHVLRGCDVSTWSLQGAVGFGSQGCDACGVPNSQARIVS